MSDLIAMRNADFEVYHEMFMVLFNAAPDKYRSGVEMAQDIIAQRDDLQRQLGEALRLLRLSLDECDNETLDEISMWLDAHGGGK